MLCLKGEIIIISDSQRYCSNTDALIHATEDGPTQVCAVLCGQGSRDVSYLLIMVQVS